MREGTAGQRDATKGADPATAPPPPGWCRPKWERHQVQWRTAWSRTTEEGRAKGEATWEEKGGGAQGSREAREAREEEGEAR